MDTHLAQRVRNLRLQRHLSQRALARQSKVSLGVIRRIEEGVGDPYDHTLSKLADFFGVTLDDLLKQAS